MEDHPSCVTKTAAAALPERKNEEKGGWRGEKGSEEEKGLLES